MSREIELREGQVVGYVTRDKMGEYITKPGKIRGIGKHGVTINDGTYILDYKLQGVLPGFSEALTQGVNFRLFPEDKKGIETKTKT